MCILSPVRLHLTSLNSWNNVYFLRSLYERSEQLECESNTERTLRFVWQFMKLVCLTNNTSKVYILSIVLTCYSTYTFSFIWITFIYEFCKLLERRTEWSVNDLRLSKCRHDTNSVLKGCSELTSTYFCSLIHSTHCFIRCQQIIKLVNNAFKSLTCRPPIMTKLLFMWTVLKII